MMEVVSSFERQSFSEIFCEKTTQIRKVALRHGVQYNLSIQSFHRLLSIFPSILQLMETTGNSIHLNLDQYHTEIQDNP